MPYQAQRWDYRPVCRTYCLRSRIEAVSPQTTRFTGSELDGTHLFCMAGVSGGEEPSRLNNVRSSPNLSRHAQVQIFLGSVIEVLDPNLPVSKGLVATASTYRLASRLHITAPHHMPHTTDNCRGVVADDIVSCFE